MSYGSYAYGSTALAGASASQGTFFTPAESLARGVYRRSLEYPGAATFFQVETRMETGEPSETLRYLRIYSHNDPSETPQLQTTVGADAFYTQSIVGAARFIVAELEFVDPWPTSPSIIHITVSGNEYFQ